MSNFIWVMLFKKIQHHQNYDIDFTFPSFQAEDSAYGKFDDFAVVAQPGLIDLSLPKNYADLFGIHRAYLPDLSYLATDCFHPSQKLHALSEFHLASLLLSKSTFAKLFCKGIPFCKIGSNSSSG